jgi:hypothetical protein
VPRPNLKAAVPGPKQIAADTLPPVRDPVTQTSAGGDFMVDVLKTLDFDYLAMTCASSFRGIHESLVNYGRNTKPEILTCPHEEIAVAMAQGYAKMEGKPMAMMCHGVVGLQHASMALYNAWCDRVPVYVMIGNIVEADKRAPGGEWAHAAIDPAATVRDFVKWDDQPASLQHFAESAVRAYKIATTPPMAPVLLSLDAELQENPIAEPEGLRIPKLAKVVPPEADSGAVAELAKMLVTAESPVMVCDRLARTPAGMAHLVELAETLQCAVVDVGGRMNFPSRHPLNHSFGRAVINQADVIVGLEMNDFWGAVNSFTDRIVRTSRSTIRKGAKLVTLGTRDLLIKSNYQDFGRYQEVDLAIVGDGETSLPALTEAGRRQVRLRGPWQEARRRPAGVARAGEVQRNRRLGCEPDLGRPAVHGGLRSDQGRGLVIGRRQHRQYLAAPAVELRQGASLERRQRGWRCRIYFAGFARRGARQQAARTADRFHRGRWRLHVCARHALDRRAPPHPDAVCRAQQPCLSPGIHAPAGNRRPPQPRRHQHVYRHHAQGSEHRLRGSRQGFRRPRRGPGQRSQRPGARAQARDRHGQEWPAGAGRCRDRAALRVSRRDAR